LAGFNVATGPSAITLIYWLNEATVARERTGAVGFLASARVTVILRQRLLVVVGNLTEILINHDENGLEPVGDVLIGAVSVEVRASADCGNNHVTILHILGINSLGKGDLAIRKEAPSVVVGVGAIVEVRVVVAHDAIAAGVEAGAHLVLDSNVAAEAEPLCALDRQKERDDTDSGGEELHGCLISEGQAGRQRRKSRD